MYVSIATDDEVGKAALMGNAVYSRQWARGAVVRHSSALLGDSAGLGFVDMLDGLKHSQAVNCKRLMCAADR